MDAVFAELDQAASAAKLLGYLNFSDGRPEPRWQKLLGEAYGLLANKGIEQPWVVLNQWLGNRLLRLQQESVAGFHEITQAGAALDIAFQYMLPGYRAFHADLLFHQTDAVLFQPYFLALVFEAVLAVGVEGLAGDEAKTRATQRVIERLNDFVGHRPIALLETRPRGEPYDHERVRPVPLFLRGAGVAPGPYHTIVDLALNVLAKTDPTILADASFDPRLLDELAFDPRAYDHTHPVNRRPNYVFGEWDPHHIDNQGRYRRFVVRQVALDGLLERVTQPGPISGDERLIEAGAVLAGTILMASGISGAGPETHDSTVTLASLMPRIARYRDAFYAEWLAKTEGAHGQRLRKEAQATHQAFGGARQHFNRHLSAQRALQLQQRHMAELFAEMGYSKAGQREAERIPTPSLRLHSIVKHQLATARWEAEHGSWAASAERLIGIQKLFERGIGCGAFVDPWNILGFQALFPLFSSREDAVRDGRVDDLVNLVAETFDLHTWLMSECAATGQESVVTAVGKSMADLAAWWDVFATREVSDVRPIAGGESVASARQVARALAQWKARGSASADLGFWREHVSQFRSARAFAIVVDVLLGKGDYQAAMALLITWIGHLDQAPQEEGEHSFAALALRWMLGLTGQHPSRPEVWSTICKFFDYLEANAEDYWQAPRLESHQPLLNSEERLPPDDLYRAAYEDVTYRDTTDDGTQGNLVDDSSTVPPFDLEEDSSRLEKRLRFLSTLFRLWQIAARFDLDSGPAPARAGNLTAWMVVARQRQQELLDLTSALHAYPVPEPIGGHEELVEYDRRRVIKEQLLMAAIGACLDNILAIGALQGAIGVLDPEGTHRPKQPSETEIKEEVTWGPLAIQIETALLRGDSELAKAVLPRFLELFRREPLLSQALSEGGSPRQIIRVRVAQTILRALAANLPRLGLIRETFHVLRLAWNNEREHPPSGRGITEFNHLFQAAYQGVVECVIESAHDWGPAGGDRPLVEILEALTAPFLSLWIEHSRSLQLGALETLRTEQNWETLRDFIKRYGRDLFHARFMTLANLRAILHRGVGSYLEYLTENPDPLHPVRLLDDMDKSIRKPEAVACIQIILQAVIENYEEYKDYNTTTTLSDYGDNLYVLLDFLRLKAAYEREAWQFRPFILAHEMLARANRSAAALLWQAAFTQLSNPMADRQEEKLKELERLHGVHLATIADCVTERFVKPLSLARLAALIGPAMAEADQSQESASFLRLQQELRPLVAVPSGVGLDVPYWLRGLEMEVQRVRALRSPVARLAEEMYRVPKKKIARENLENQLRDWEAPL